MVVTLKTLTFSLIALLLIILASCSSQASGSPKPDEVLSVRETAERLISNDIAEEIQLGDLSPVCEEVPNPTYNTTFDCSATASEDRIIYLNGKVEQDGRISLETSNVILKNDLVKYETPAVAYVNEKLGTQFPSNVLDCGDDSIILNTHRVISCSFIEPGSGDVYDAKVKIDDISNFLVSVQVSNTPRG